MFSRLAEVAGEGAAEAGRGRGMDAAEVAAEEAATRRSGRPAALAILPRTR